MKIFQQKITAKDCDVYNHMNTLKYIQKFYEAADEYFLKFGMSDPILAKEGIGCAYLEFNTAFKKEVFAGEEIIIEMEIAQASRKVMTITMQMKRLPEKEVVSEAVLKYLFFDLATRKSLLLKDEKLQKYLAF